MGLSSANCSTLNGALAQTTMCGWKFSIRWKVWAFGFVCAIKTAKIIAFYSYTLWQSKVKRAREREIEKVVSLSNRLIGCGEWVFIIKLYVINKTHQSMRVYENRTKLVQHGGSWMSNWIIKCYFSMTSNWWFCWNYPQVFFCIKWKEWLFWRACTSFSYVAWIEANKFKRNILV